MYIYNTIIFYSIHNNNSNQTHPNKNTATPILCVFFVSGNALAAMAPSNQCPMSMAPLSLQYHGLHLHPADGYWAAKPDHCVAPSPPQLPGEWNEDRWNEAANI